MKTLDQANPDAMFCMFKGEPGTRKSTQALSFPGKQYWFSCDKKMQALALPAKHWGIDPKTIEYDDYSNWNDVRARLEIFQGKPKPKFPYRTIVVDSITSMAANINRQTLADVTGGPDSRKGQSVGGIFVGTFDDYKAEVAAFQELIALLKDINTYFECHVIMIAHVVGERVEVTGSRTHHARIIASGSRNLSAILSAYSTEVYHFDIRESTNPDMEGKYGLITVHTGEDFARTALPLPRRVEFGNEQLYPKYLKPAIQKLHPVTTTEKE